MSVNREVVVGPAVLHSQCTAVPRNGGLRQLAADLCRELEVRAKGRGARRQKGAERDSPHAVERKSAYRKRNFFVF